MLYYMLDILHCGPLHLWHTGLFVQAQQEP